jgi:hypothetical protein
LPRSRASYHPFSSNDYVKLCHRMFTVPSPSNGRVLLLNYSSVHRTCHDTDIKFITFLFASSVILFQPLVFEEGRETKEKVNSNWLHNSYLTRRQKAEFCEKVLILGTFAISRSENYHFV